MQNKTDWVLITISVVHNTSYFVYLSIAIYQCNNKLSIRITFQTETIDELGADVVPVPE